MPAEEAVPADEAPAEAASAVQLAGRRAASSLALAAPHHQRRRDASRASPRPGAPPSPSARQRDCPRGRSRRRAIPTKKRGWGRLRAASAGGDGCARRPCRALWAVLRLPPHARPPPTPRRIVCEASRLRDPSQDPPTLAGGGAARLARRDQSPSPDLDRRRSAARRLSSGSVRSA